MKLHFISGIYGDRVEVSVGNDFKQRYSFGYNASYNREMARTSQPYIGDIIKDIVETNYIQKEDIEYSGRYVFLGRDMTEKEVEETFNRIFAEV